VTDDRRVSFVQGECCGINNYTDWGLNEQYNKSESVPDSCCKDDKDGCGQGGLIDPEKINTHVCRCCDYESTPCFHTNTPCRFYCASRCKARS